MNMQENFQFDRVKFKDVVHFVIAEAERTFGVDRLGNVKLHKILYYSDMLRYLEVDQPLTGAEYQRQKFGPTARYLSKFLSELSIEGLISVTATNYFGYPKKDYRSLIVPNTNRLSPDEISLLTTMTAFVCGRTATEISEFSHDDVWKSVRMGQRIPYFAAFALFPVDVTDADLDDATKEAAKLVPLIKLSRENGQVL